MIVGVMEFADGRMLKDPMVRLQRLAPPRIAAIMEDLTSIVSKNKYFHFY